MDKIDTTTEIQEENQPTKPLGELLKSYRENAAMDYDQAANTLCLTVATLQALENEQFDLLPEAPYIRGYLRSYAKLAHVSSAEAIGLYEEIRGGTATAANLQYNFAPTSSVDSIIKPAISPLLMRFGIIAIGIFSLAIISMLPDVREWSTGIWDDFSQKTVAIEAQSEQEKTTEVASKPQEARANTIVSSVTTNNPATTVTTTPEVATTTNTSPQNMDGNINRQNQSTSEDTSTDSTTTNAINAYNAAAQNSANNTAVDTAPPETTSTAVTDSAANTPTETIPTTTNTVATVENNANNPNVAANINPVNSTNTAVATTVSGNDTNANPDTTNADGTVVAAPATNDPNNSNSSDTNATTDTNGDPNTAIDTAATEENPEGENTDPEAQPNEVSIKLVFTKEVWMRVDSKKKKVFSGLKKDGDTEEFKASKPLSFKVGNAPGVEIYINGQRYDQTPHTRGAVSRFKIEETP